MHEPNVRAGKTRAMQVDFTGAEDTAQGILEEVAESDV